MFYAFLNLRKLNLRQWRFIFFKSVLHLESFTGFERRGWNSNRQLEVSIPAEIEKQARE